MASKYEEAIPMAPKASQQPHVVVMATDDAETTPGCCCCDDGCEEENEERGNWSCNFESILASISYGVGPGYLWAMPASVFRNGGGTFLYVYMVLQIFIGFPIVYLEMALGQYTSQGPIRAWRGVPILQGVGFGMVVMSAILSIYYNGFVAKMLYYLFYVSGDLSRATSCNNPWNTPECYTGGCGKVVEFDDYGYNYTYTSCGSQGAAASEYLDYYVVQQTDGLHDMGAVRGPLAGCLFLAWLLVLLALSFGVKSLGKMAYVTTLLPMFFIFLLFIRAVTLPGASDGIWYFMAPSVNYYYYGHFGVFSALITAIVHRLTLGYGGYTTLASYNRFHNNVLRDAVVVVFVDLLVTIFCVLTISGFFGYIASVNGVSIENAVTGGTTMNYVVMVTMFSQLPLGSSWAALFFLTVVLLAYGCQAVYMETVITSLTDLIPSGLINKLPGKDSGLLSKRAALRGVMTLAVCFLFFLLGLPYVTQGGEYLSVVVSTYNSYIQPYIFVLLECVALALLYSPTCSRCCPAIRRWMSELGHMLQHVCCSCCATVVNWFAAVAWLSYIPLVILVYLISIRWWPSSLYVYSYEFPTGAIVLGHLILCASLVMVPLLTIINIIVALVKRKPANIVRPPADWGPYLSKHRKGVA